jgi:hypothetical protein
MSHAICKAALRRQSWRTQKSGERPRSSAQTTPKLSTKSKWRRRWLEALLQRCRRAHIAARPSFTVMFSEKRSGPAYTVFQQEGIRSSGETSGNPSRRPQCPSDTLSKPSAVRGFVISPKASRPRARSRGRHSVASRRLNRHFSCQIPFCSTRPRSKEPRQTPMPEPEASDAYTNLDHGKSRLVCKWMHRQYMIQHSYRQDAQRRVGVKYLSEMNVYRLRMTARPARLYMHAATKCPTRTSTCWPVTSGPDSSQRSAPRSSQRRSPILLTSGRAPPRSEPSTVALSAVSLTSCMAKPARSKRRKRRSRVAVTTSSEMPITVMLSQYGISATSVGRTRGGNGHAPRARRSSGKPASRTRKRWAL